MIKYFSIWSVVGRRHSPRMHQHVCRARACRDVRKHRVHRAPRPFVTSTLRKTWRNLVVQLLTKRIQKASRTVIPFLGKKQFPRPESPTADRLHVPWDPPQGSGAAARRPRSSFHIPRISPHRLTPWLTGGRSHAARCRPHGKDPCLRPRPAILSPHPQDLLRQMLMVDPKRRISAVRILKHPW